MNNLDILKARIVLPRTLDEVYEQIDKHEALGYKKAEFTLKDEALATLVYEDLERNKAISSVSLLEREDGYFITAKWKKDREKKGG